MIDSIPPTLAGIIAALLWITAIYKTFTTPSTHQEDTNE